MGRGVGGGGGVGGNEGVKHTSICVNVHTISVSIDKCSNYRICVPHPKIRVIKNFR